MGAVARLFSRIKQIPDSGCWEWQGKKLPRGYGQMYYNGGHKYVHRIVWFWLTGEWPPVVRHTCDNPPCCNPKHLRGGTQKDNMVDCVEKGRHVSGFTGWPEVREHPSPEGRGPEAARDEKGRYA